jgi:mycothiol synthase
LANSAHRNADPGVPTGFVGRPATFDDLDLVQRLFADVDIALFGEAEPSRVWIEEDWSSDWVDLATMSRLILAPDGTLAGYANLEAVDPSSEVGAFGRVHPAYVGRALGSSLVRWSEAVAATLVRSGKTSSLRHSISGADAAARELLTRAGFIHVRTAWHMRMELPERYLAGEPPSGVRIRSSVAGRDDREIWETMEAAFRTHFGYQPIGFEQWWDNTRRTGAYDPSLVLVAEADDRIVGASHQFVLPESGVGWVGDLGVRPELQGRGIGKSLLRHALADLSRRGFRVAQLNVDSQNETGAVELYRSVGMTVYREWLDLAKTIEGAGGATLSR